MRDRTHVWLMRGAKVLMLQRQDGAFTCMDQSCCSILILHGSSDLTPWTVIKHVGGHLIFHNTVCLFMSHINTWLPHPSECAIVQRGKSEELLWNNDANGPPCVATSKGNMDDIVTFDCLNMFHAICCIYCTLCNVYTHLSFSVFVRSLTKMMHSSAPDPTI